MIGRDPQRRWLEEHLKNGGVVQIVGPPGMGKTTLVSATLEGRDAIWVALETVSPDDLDGALARALGVPVETPAIQSALSATSILVLDGAESLVEVLPDHLDRWRAADTPSVVITTRNRIPVGRVLELGPLDPDDAVELFVDRAMAAAATLDLSEESDAVVALAERLMGWPLAIELAASRVRLFSPTEMLAEPPMEVLRDPRRRDRHASLQTALQTSWDRLDATARSALTHATWFGNEFTRDAFTAATGASPLVLEGLLDASFVHWRQARSGRRYRLLPPIRSFVVEQSPDREASLARFAEVVLSETDAAWPSVEGPDAAEALDTLTQWAPELQAILDAAAPAQSARAAFAIAALARARGGVDHAIRCLGAVDSAVLPEDLAYTFDLVLTELQLHALPAPAEIPQLDRWGDDPRVLRLKGLHHRWRFELDTALDVLTHAHQQAVERQDDDALARICLNLGSIRLQQGQADAAARRFEEALTAIRRLDLPVLEAVLLEFLAMAQRVQASPPHPRLARLERATDLYRRTGNMRRSTMGSAWANLARADARDPDIDAHIATADAATAALGMSVTQSHLAILKGLVALERGAPREAREAAFQTPDAADIWIRSASRAVRGLAEHLLDRPRSALALLDEAIAGFESAGVKVEARLYASARAILSGQEPPGDPPAPDAVPAIHDIAWKLADCAYRDKPVSSEIASLAENTIETRLLMRLIHHAPTFVIARDGSWFRKPDGTRIDLDRRRILRAFIRTFAENLGNPLSKDDLIEAVWPGQTLAGTSGRARVHVAISELRKLGLRAALVTDNSTDTTTYSLRATVE